jgi:hypothetical protein
MCSCRPFMMASPTGCGPVENNISPDGSVTAVRRRGEWEPPLANTILAGFLLRDAAPTSIAT